MIQIDDKGKCCGCGACVQSCPKKCIKMTLDKEGFWYPEVDKNRCIDCKICEKKCHLIQGYKKENTYQSRYFAAINKDKNIRKSSSSGGIFTPLAKWILDEKGVVYGAVDEGMQVKHERATNIYELERFRKSKYLQSDTSDIFIQVQEDLKSNKRVLFSGTPCQVAALYHFLKYDYENLYTCDVVCHGVPSYKVFKMYIDELEKIRHQTVVSICWRDKRNGWNPNHISVKFGDNEELCETSQINAFQKGFLNNLYLRPSCYECPYAKLPRVGDISLADFWGYEGEIDHLNLGVSAVIISSAKGEILFKEIEPQLEIECVEEEYLKRKSRHVYLPPKYNEKREKFFWECNENSTFEKLDKKYIHPNYFRKWLNRLEYIRDLGNKK